MNEEFVWVFHGVKGRFSSGVFSSLGSAENWIAKFKLSGILTQYPLDKGVYDWSVENGTFEIKKQAHQTPEFIQTFTCASQDHYHYEYGQRA